MLKLTVEMIVRLKSVLSSAVFGDFPPPLSLSGRMIFLTVLIYTGRTFFQSTSAASCTLALSLPQVSHEGPICTLQCVKWETLFLNTL